MSHTPAPWNVWRDRVDNSVNVSGSRENGFPFVCLVGKDSPYEQDAEINRINSDARLIAAAPDLLKALAALEGEVVALGVNGCSQQIAAARAAIAKATQS